MNSFDEEDGGKRMKMCHTDIKCSGLNEHLACQSSCVLQNIWCYVSTPILFPFIFIWVCESLCVSGGV